MTTRNEAVHFLKTHSVWHMRRNRVPEEFKDLVAVACSLRWNDDGDEILGANDALAKALNDVFPVEKQIVKGTCPRCGGTGHIHAFRHMDGGRCFACEGTGKD